MIKHVTKSCYIISHHETIQHNQIATSSNSYFLTGDLFQIQRPFIDKPNHKNISPLAKQIFTIYSEEVTPYFLDITVQNIQEDKSTANDLAIELQKQFFDSSASDYSYTKFNGENNTDEVVLAKINNSDDKDKEYVFPPRCKFFNCDLFNFHFDLRDCDKYDFVVVDPPWQNKFIKRRKLNNAGYDTHDAETIESLPVSKILLPGAIVAIWSTNSKSEAILTKILPKWGLHLLKTFYWLKVTTLGKLTTPFTKDKGKQPFETLILTTNSSTMQPLHTSEEIKLLVSTPSAINSHKPPLTSVLEHYFDKKFTSKCELFARYLQEGYTSYGNQVCKLNNKLLFEKYPIA